MKKLLLIMLAFLPLVVKAGKAETPDTISARRAFVEMPTTVLDILSPDTRLDMLDYFDADREYVATNDLRGESRLLTLTPDYAEVNVTPVSTLQIKVLPLKNKSQVVMAIYTVGEAGGASESDVYFFDSKMQPVAKEKFFKEPGLADFFDLKGSSLKAKDLDRYIPFHSVVYRLNPDNTLTATLAIDDILPIETRQLLTPRPLTLNLKL